MTVMRTQPLRRFGAPALALVAGLSVAGCNPVAGGLSPGASTPQVVAAIAPSEPAGPPPIAGVAAGPAGSSLSEADRRIAADAQYEALQKGQRKSWKSKTGTAFGFVEPGADNGGCREYSHTIYIEGRPQKATGQGCRQPDGSFRLT